jgi:DNA-binding NarL/FixJ family response regulator
VRQGIRSILSHEPDLVVCGEATTGRQALDMAFELKPDVMILDLGLPEMNGVEVTRRVRASLPVAVLIVTVHDADRMAQDAIDAGASGFVLKADAARVLVDAVRAILRHGTFISERMRPAADLGSFGGQRHVRRSEENATRHARASDVARARGAAVAGGGPGQQGDRDGARHLDENG